MCVRVGVWDLGEQTRKKVARMEQLLKLKEVAAMTRNCDRFIRNATGKRAKPRLKFIRLGNRLRFREADVLEWLKHYEKYPSKNEAA